MQVSGLKSNWASRTRVCIILTGLLQQPTLWPSKVWYCQVAAYQEFSCKIGLADKILRPHDASSGSITLATSRISNLVQDYVAYFQSPAWFCTNIHKGPHLPIQTNSSLRSSSKNLLRPPRKGNTMFYSDQAFCTAAPLLWNKLPDQIKSATSVNQFKTLLKTNLFKLAYNSGTF